VGLQSVTEQHGKYNM